MKYLIIALAFTFSGCAGSISPETRAALYHDYKTVKPVAQKIFVDLLTSYVKAYVAKENGFSK